MAAKKKIKLDLSKLVVVEIIPKLQSIKNITANEQSDSTNIKYGIELVPFFALLGDLIKIDLKITMSFQNDENNDDLLNAAEFAYDFVYRYDSLKDLQDSKGELTPDIFLTCSNISYSTLRGIIYAKSADTCIANALIPIVTGSELMDGLIKK